MQIQKALSELVSSRIVFTDVYVRTGEPMRARTPAGWAAVNKENVTREDMESFLRVIAGPEWFSMLQKSPTQSLDIAKTIGGSARLRCNVAFSGRVDESVDHLPIDDVTISIRKLSLMPPDFSETGLPARLLQDILNKKGLWIVTGPTGNGKSTTLASVLQHMNSSMSSHIITIEHPIEYVLRPSKSIISQKEVGQHVPSFNAGLTAAMRQRPDVILIGEVRDQDTMETLLQAGESGHLVLASLHTKNAVDAITKITGFLQGSGSTSNKLNTLASVLVGVVAQNLVPTADGKNLVLAYEVLMNTPEVAQLIRREEFQKLPNALAAGRSQGSVPLNDRLKELLVMKKIKDATALAVSSDPQSLQKEMYL